MSQKQYDEIYTRRIADWQRMAHWISGQDIDEKKLAKEQKRFNRTLRKVNKINELRRKHRTYLLNLPAAYIILGVGNYFGEPDEYEEILDLFIEEYSNLKEGEYDGERIPLVWSGARSVDFGICYSLDQAGAMLADWNVPTGLHNFFNEEENPLEALIHYTLGYPGIGPKEAMGIAGLEKMIQRTDAQGVLFYNYLGCPMCAVNTFLSGGYVKQKLGIPSLSLDGSFPTEAPTGQLITRIEAFAEMLRGKQNIFEKETA
jgi:benzoyl-CoA reductase/2-hydroxyglutaryl-CoA dehydratase subunit BcrC/BadD/HgdB